MVGRRCRRPLFIKRQKEGGDAISGIHAVNALGKPQKSCGLPVVVATTFCLIMADGISHLPTSKAA